MNRGFSFAIVFLSMLTPFALLAQTSTKEDDLSEAEIARRQAVATLRAINKSLRPLGPGEQRLIGHVKKIDCTTSPITFAVNSADASLTVVARDFDSLNLRVLSGRPMTKAVGCSSDLSSYNAVIGYRKATKAAGKDELLSIEFVADDFRIFSAEELSDDSDELRFVTTDSETPEARKARERAIIEGIRHSISEPADGEKREIGFLDGIDCDENRRYYKLRIGSTRLRLSATDSLVVRLFTTSLNGTDFGCGMKAIPTPVVFIYKTTAAELLSLDFVPKSFTLD